MWTRYLPHTCLIVHWFQTWWLARLFTVSVFRDVAGLVAGRDARALVTAQSSASSPVLLVGGRSDGELGALRPVGRLPCCSEGSCRRVVQYVFTRDGFVVVRCLSAVLGMALLLRQVNF